MSAFALLPALARALFALWALLLCLAGLFGAVSDAVRKRFGFAALALPVFAPAYLLWQVIFDLYLSGGTEAAAGLSAALGRLPWLGWLLTLAALTLAAALLLLSGLRYEKTALTPGAIKLFLDRLPCGVCCWRDSGRVLFSNDCMNRLCVQLTGGPLLNGEQFRSAAAGGLLTADGRVWRLTSRSLSDAGLQEMIASDITAEYARTRSLERDKAELSQLNRELRDYYAGLDEAIRRREVLQAKANIHDEMNRLMLSTTAAGGEDPAALDRIFSLWEKNALLLCMEADRAGDAGDAESLETLAAALKLRLVWRGALPESLSEAQRELFFSAAREALANAVKHAGAKELELFFDETETQLFCRFRNGGSAPAGPLRFTGGLRNLAYLAERQGARVTAEARDGFTLSLCFPKNQPID